MESSREYIYKKIDAYIKGSLEEKEIEELWVEFAKAPELLDELELEVGIKELIEKHFSSATKEQASIHKLPKWIWHASAAAAILMVALVQFFRVDTPTDISDFLVINIPESQVETSDGIRAKDMVISTADSLLNLGFAAIVSGNNNRALELFDTIIDKYDMEPYGSKAFLNKGIINYNESMYEAAAANFEAAIERAKENRMISEKAYWYLGNAYINLGEMEKAFEAVGEAYKKDGIFRKSAYVLYQKLSYDLGKVDFEDTETTPSN